MQRSVRPSIREVLWYCHVKTKRREQGQRNPASDSRATGPNQFKMIVIEPQGFDECPKLVDSLKAKAHNHQS